MHQDAGIGLLRRSSIITRTALRSGWFALGRGSAGGCGAVPRTSRSSGWSEKSWSSASSTLLVAAFVQLENPIPRPVWAGVAPGHRHVVRHLLEQPAAG